MQINGCVKLMTRFGLIELLITAQYYPDSPCDNRIDNLELVGLHGIEEDLLDYWDYIADDVVDYLLHNLDMFVKQPTLAIDYELIKKHY